MDQESKSLERIARATERIAARLGVIEWLLIGWIALRFLMEILTIRTPAP